VSERVSECVCVNELVSGKLKNIKVIVLLHLGSGGCGGRGGGHAVDEVEC